MVHSPTNAQNRDHRIDETRKRNLATNLRKFAFRRQNESRTNLLRRRPVLEPQTVKNRHIELYCFTDFVEANIFIRSVRAARIARTDFYRRERHQRLVAQRRRAERLSAKRNETTHNGMTERNRRRTKPRAARLQSAVGHRRTNHLQRMLIAVGIRRAHVNNDSAQIRNNIINTKQSSRLQLSLKVILIIF